MRRLRTILASLGVALTVLAGGAVAVPAPAHADDVVCGDTPGSWVLVAQAYALEVFFSPSTDYTGEVVFTSSGQLAATVIDDTIQVFTGTWEHDGTTLTWSATDVADNSYRLTFIATASDCGLLGGVRSAYGDIIQTNVGPVGLVAMTRIP